jgi:hypothetical protein
VYTVGLRIFRLGLRDRWLNWCMHDVRAPRVGTARSASLVVALALFAAACADAPDAVAVVTGNSEATIDSDPAIIDSDPATRPGTTPPATTPQIVGSEPPGTTTTTTDAPTSSAASPEESSTCPTRADLLRESKKPARVILDTDFTSDVDDVGALAVLHALADAGEVEILAVMVSDGGDAPSHQAIDAINTYYARPDVPIGVVAGAAPAFPSAYVTALASEFPNDIENPPAAVDLYREILAAEPDDSVTIVSVGYLTNLDALLSSPPDERNASSGEQLVAAKVTQWVAMGGYYPDSVDHPFDAEFNFAEDVTATLNSAADWPTDAVFSGWEVGEIVLTGAALQAQTPPENPVREAYRLFNGGEDHRSWDLTAVLAAVRGTAGLFEVCAGRNVIGPGGSNMWQLGEEGPHGFLRLVVPAADVASVLDGLLIAPPTRS